MRYSWSSSRALPAWLSRVMRAMRPRADPQMRVAATLALP